MYEITKNIPMPPRRMAYKFPVADMEIGDSFEIPPDEKIAVHDCVRYYEKKNKGKKFTTRKMPDGKYRCWRIS